MFCHTRFTKNIELSEPMRKNINDAKGLGGVWYIVLFIQTDIHTITISYCKLHTYIPIQCGHKAVGISFIK